MRQEALVLEGGETARVMVLRSSACTGDCGSCGGCHEAKPIYADARNAIGAEKGQAVYVETETGVVMISAVLVYLLPLGLFLAGYFIAQALGASGPFPAVCALGAAVLGFFGAKRYDRKRAGQPACAIVAFR